MYDNVKLTLSKRKRECAFLKFLFISESCIKHLTRLCNLSRALSKYWAELFQRCEYFMHGCNCSFKGEAFASVKNKIALY